MRLSKINENNATVMQSTHHKFTLNMIKHLSAVLLTVKATLGLVVTC